MTQKLEKARQKHIKGYLESCLGLLEIQTDAKLARVEKAKQQFAELRTSVDSELDKVQEIFAGIRAKVADASLIGLEQEQGCLNKETKKRIDDAFNMSKIDVSNTWNEQDKYWQAKREKIETCHSSESQKITEGIAKMEAQLKELFGVPKKSQYVLKKLEIYEALDQDPQPSQTFEFPTQADFDQVEDKQNIRLAEITAVKEFSKNLVSLSLKLTDGTNSSLLGCQKPKQKNSFTTYRTNFKVREI